MGLDPGGVYFLVAEQLLHRYLTHAEINILDSKMESILFEWDEKNKSNLRVICHGKRIRYLHPKWQFIIILPVRKFHKEKYHGWCRYN